MRTPDEIKKGLELCYEDIDCSECPYLDECFGNDEEPFGAVMPDALAYIQQLERERDALLKYLTDSHWAACDICKHNIDGSGTEGCNHIRENSIPCFEWIGVKEELRK